VDVAQRDLQVVPDRREVAATQLLVNGHQPEIIFGERLRHIHHPLGRMQADELQTLRKILAQHPPRVAAQRGGHRMTVEHGKRQRAQSGKLLAPEHDLAPPLGEILQARGRTY
jgi:hypothetical protein